MKFDQDEFYREVLCIIENELTHAFHSLIGFTQSNAQHVAKSKLKRKLNDLEQCAKLSASENVANLSKMSSSLGVFQGPIVFPSPTTINSPQIANHKLTLTLENQCTQLSSIKAALEVEVQPLEHSIQVLSSALINVKLTKLDRHTKLLTKFQKEIHQANMQAYQYTSGLHVPTSQAIQALQELDKNLI